MRVKDVFASNLDLLQSYTVLTNQGGDGVYYTPVHLDYLLKRVIIKVQFEDLSIYELLILKTIASSVKFWKNGGTNSTIDEFLTKNGGLNDFYTAMKNFNAVGKGIFPDSLPITGAMVYSADVIFNGPSIKCLCGIDPKEFFKNTGDPKISDEEAVQNTILALIRDNLYKLWKNMFDERDMIIDGMIDRSRYADSPSESVLIYSFFDDIGNSYNFLDDGDTQGKVIDNMRSYNVNYKDIRGEYICNMPLIFYLLLKLYSKTSNFISDRCDIYKFFDKKKSYQMKRFDEMIQGDENFAVFKNVVNYTNQVDKVMIGNRDLNFMWRSNFLSSFTPVTFSIILPLDTDFSSLFDNLDEFLDNRYIKSFFDDIDNSHSTLKTAVINMLGTK